MPDTYEIVSRRAKRLESLSEQLLLDCKAMARYLASEAPTPEMVAYALATAEKHQGPKMARAKAA